MVYLITVHDRKKRLSNLDKSKNFETKVWESIMELTKHKIVLYPIETYNALEHKALPNRVNIVFANKSAIDKKSNVLINNNPKDIINNFSEQNEDIYILASTPKMVDLFCKDVDFIIDYSTEELGFTNISIFDAINFANFTLLKKIDMEHYTLRYFARELTNFIGF